MTTPADQAILGRIASLLQTVADLEDQLAELRQELAAERDARSLEDRRLRQRIDMVEMRRSA